MKYHYYKSLDKFIVVTCKDNTIYTAKGKTIEEAKEELYQMINKNKK